MCGQGVVVKGSFFVFYINSDGYRSIARGQVLRAFGEM